MNQHTLKVFDADIGGMRGNVTAMGTLVLAQFSRSLDAVDLGDLQLAAQVVADEALVNRYHIQADRLCSQILAKRQPMAADLREVIGAMHAVDDLERIGDEAKRIARRAEALAQRPGRDGLPLARMRALGEIVLAMLSDAMGAYSRRDALVAAALRARHAQVDAARDSFEKALRAQAAAEPGATEGAMDLAFVLQLLGRVSEHSLDIAECVVNVVEGVDARHSAAPV
ncbi:MAG TPA: phosphate signaling complex protein PhoU [Quisquiliibacterium sp.]|nr:phosphate signaling complex protein PhoU [Quisquiliibacterium sp.]